MDLGFYIATIGAVLFVAICFFIVRQLINHL